MHRGIWAGALVAAIVLFGGEECALAQNKKLVLGTPGKTPVTYDRLVDPTVWTDAVAPVPKGS